MDTGCTVVQVDRSRQRRFEVDGDAVWPWPPRPMVVAVVDMVGMGMGKGREDAEGLEQGAASWDRLPTSSGHEPVCAKLDGSRETHHGVGSQGVCNVQVEGSSGHRAEAP